MGKTLRKAPKALQAKPRRRSLWLINILLLLIPLTFLGYRPLLGRVGNLLVVSETPRPSDAIVVLAGGDPGRALRAAELYQAHLAPYVVISTEQPPHVFEEVKKHGVELFQSYENNVRILEGYGVPERNIIRIEPYVQDTLDELGHVRDLAHEKKWKSLIVVTSNFHTRRARMVCRYVLEPQISAIVVASNYDSFNPNAWWTTQDQLRTFSVEVEKLVVYAAYIWPRLLWK